MQQIDWHLFKLINGLARHVGALDSIMKFCAQGLEYVMLVLVATLWITPGDDYGVTIRRQRLVVYAVLSALLALGINQLIGLAWFRPRPFALHPDQVKLLIAHSPDSGFPSDHAAGGFALATAVSLTQDRWARRLSLLLFGLATLLAFSRVYVGAHYPFDVIAGAIVGVGAALVIRLAQPLIQPVLQMLLAPLHRLTYLVTERLGIQRWQVRA